MRIAVSGAGGRLGRALLAALADAGLSSGGELLAWDVPQHDLDDPASAERLVAAGRPDLVIHCAAWTDVDGCAREPALALRRNGTATGEMAAACVAHGAGLVTISTNEVFDGRRTDGLGYRPGDATGPINPYGASKLAGELAARAAFGAGVGTVEWLAPLAIVRTAWLFGAPGGDFPARLLVAAERARAAGTALQLVSDEVGSPTSAADLARAIAALVGAGGFGGVWHLVNEGAASRAELGREVLRLAGMDVATLDVPAAGWVRASTPPAWAPLEPSDLPGGLRMRGWREALAEYVPTLLAAHR